MKEGPGLLDTGPLVSFLAYGLRRHSWACEQWKFFCPPLLTCEPVPIRWDKEKSLNVGDCEIGIATAPGEPTHELQTMRQPPGVCAEAAHPCANFTQASNAIA